MVQSVHVSFRQYFTDVYTIFLKMKLWPYINKTFKFELLKVKFNIMKKILILAFVLINLMMNSASSQTYVIQVRPVGSDDWGFAGLDGKLILKAQFHKCSGFSKEGLASIFDKKSKKYYIINLKGESLPVEISDFEIKSVFFIDVPHSFEDGMLIVGKDKKWGFINSQGKLVIPMKYDRVSEFNGGCASAQIDGKWFVLDKEGVEHPINNNTVSEINHFTENLAPFKTFDKAMGFIDVNGQIAIQPHYTALGFFSDSLAWARDSYDKIGYINHKGEWVIKPQFDVARNFDAEAGLARVKINDNWEYVTTKGEIIQIKDTKSFDDFFDGLAMGEKNDKKGFFNNKGEWVIQPQFDDAKDFKYNYAAVKKDGRWGVIDKEGKWMIQPTFDAIKDIQVVDK
jgi:hypothetical protein